MTFVEHLQQRMRRAGMADEATYDYGLQLSFCTLLDSGLMMVPSLDIWLCCSLGRRIWAEPNYQ